MGKIRKVLIVGIVALAALVQPALAGSTWNLSRWTGVAIDGADAVAYFTQARAVEGSRKFTHLWMGAKWRFASAANRDAFAADPAKYAPQYGGYCAWAVAQGYTAPIDREAWKIVGGKLYLNYSKSIQAQWAEDVPGNIRKGDGNWPGVRTKLAKD
jgi:hypothetical protein